MEEKKIERMQYITQDNDKYTHAEQALLMYENGIKWVQLRMKNHFVSEVKKQAEEAMGYAFKYGAKLLINDYIDIAQDIGAHGVHLGLNDIEIDKARQVLGRNAIIGGTANTYEDIIMQVNRGADYIGLGPYKYTTTKKNISQVLGSEGYIDILKKVVDCQIKTPIIAVGGIEMHDIDFLETIGLSGVAISSALINEYCCVKNI